LQNKFYAFANFHLALFNLNPYKERSSKLRWENYALEK